MKSVIAVSLAALTFTASANARPHPIPTSFEAVGADREAIQTLLDTYAKAVSSKDQALFETLLLNKDIPFSDAAAATQPGVHGERIQNYDDFRQGVFGGPPFIQRFQDVHIEQDGALAQVSLVFVNKATDGKSWGWKTMQLLKIGGQWKIASEFYTGHRR